MRKVLRLQAALSHPSARLGFCASPGGLQAAWVSQPELESLPVKVSGPHLQFSQGVMWRFLPEKRSWCVRKWAGRVAASIRRPTEQKRPTSVDREVSDLHEDHLEAQFSPVSFVPTTPVAVVQGGWGSVTSTSVAVPPQNRFAPLRALRASGRLVLTGGGGSSQFVSWSLPTQRSPETQCQILLES